PKPSLAPVGRPRAAGMAHGGPGPRPPAPADVDVRASEDRRNAGQHLLDHLKGRGQLWVEPRGVVRVTGREFELDDVSTGVQLRAHPHELRPQPPPALA